jgi:hypothetical protein
VSIGSKKQPDERMQPSGLSVGTDEETALIRTLAARIQRAGCVAPAVVALEVLKPLAFVGSQIGLMLAPFVGAFLRDSGRRYGQYVALFQDRDNIERLLSALDR